MLLICLLNNQWQIRNINQFHDETFTFAAERLKLALKKKMSQELRIINQWSHVFHTTTRPFGLYIRRKHRNCRKYRKQYFKIFVHLIDNRILLFANPHYLW